MRIFSAVLLAAFSLPAWAAHGYALWGELKYPPGFAHFDYDNWQPSTSLVEGFTKMLDFPDGYAG